MSQWMPIVTAPRDGTRVLMHCPFNPQHLQVSVGWVNGQGIIAFGSSFEHDLRGPVTHWMPLPPPPEGCQE